MENSLLYESPLQTTSTGIGTIVDHDTVARLQMLLHGNDANDTHQMSN